MRISAAFSTERLLQRASSHMTFKRSRAYCKTQARLWSGRERVWAAATEAVLLSGAPRNWTPEPDCTERGQATELRQRVIRPRHAPRLKGRPRKYRAWLPFKFSSLPTRKMAIREYTHTLKFTCPRRDSHVSWTTTTYPPLQ